MRKKTQIEKKQNKNKKNKKNKKKQRTTLLCNVTKQIKTDENYCDSIRFRYSNLNDNIKIILHELHQGKCVHTIPSFSKVETLVNKITQNEN